MSDKKYSVYGDDDRVELEDLDELVGDVDDVLAEDTKKRKADKKKKKEKKPVKEESFDDLEDLDDFDSETADEATEEIPIQEEKEDVEEGDEVPDKKSVPKTLIFALIAAIIVLVLVIVFVILGGSSKDVSPEETPAVETPIVETETPSTEEPTVTPEETEVPTETPEVTKEGYLKSIDRNKEYTLAETLNFAKSINNVTTDYLNGAIEAVNKYKEDSSTNIKELLSVKQELLGYDVATISTYETMFDTYSGSDYIRVSEERLENVRLMYEAIEQEYASATDLVNKANEYIQTENEQAEKMKTALRSYLDTNGVSYYEADNQISYDENQFYNQE